MSITTNKLTRIGMMAALVVTGAVACHSNDYKAQSEVPGADSGSARVSTASALGDSTAVPVAPATTSSTTVAPATAAVPAATGTKPATTTSKPATAATTTQGSAATASNAKTTNATASNAKTAHGRASIAVPKIYGNPETAPHFPGGQNALDKYISKSVNYPQQAIDDDMSGVIHVSFIVDEQGKVTKAKVIDPANIGDGLDQEALRVVKGMPSWTPGKVNGKRVRTRMELPISFLVEG